MGNLIVKIKSSCGRSLTTWCFTVVHAAIHSSVSMDLCFFICSIILFLSFPALCLANAFLCGSSGGFGRQNLQLNYDSDIQPTSVRACTSVHGRKHKPVAFIKAEGQTRRRWGGEEEWNNQIFRLQHSLVLTLEDSVISQTDPQTGGRNAGECGRNVDERVHLSFCPGIARNICGIFLYGRAHSQCGSSLSAPKKMWQMWHFRGTVPACPRARHFLRMATGLRSPQVGCRVFRAPLTYRYVTFICTLKKI